jgi:hypothetical protein
MSSNEYKFSSAFRQIIISWVISLVALLIVLTNPDLYEAQSSDPVLKLFLGILKPALLLLMLLKSILFLNAVNILISGQIGTPRVRRLMLLRTIFSLVILSLTIFPPLYKSGIHIKVAELISVYVPFLGNKLISIISKLITLLLTLISARIGDIISGLLGAFLYDTLKKAYKRLKKQTSK